MINPVKIWMMISTIIVLILAFFFFIHRPTSFLTLLYDMVFHMSSIFSERRRFFVQKMQPDENL